MGYYTRVLSKRADNPSYEELVQALAKVAPAAVLSVEKSESDLWGHLLLAHTDGSAIAAIERNPVQDGSLGQKEIAEFAEEIRDCDPGSVLPWLNAFLASVKTVYAFQHLAGAERDEGYAALKCIRDFIWRRGGAITQADREGFSNENGYHILWQFSDRVTGPWWVAVQRDGQWLQFQMELGDPEHRRAFREGRVPTGVSATPQPVD